MKKYIKDKDGISLLKLKTWLISKQITKQTIITLCLRRGRGTQEEKLGTYGSGLISQESIGCRKIPGLTLMMPIVECAQQKS